MTYYVEIKCQPGGMATKSYDVKDLTELQEAIELDLWDYPHCVVIHLWTRGEEKAAQL